jgi:hypothetical protein
LETGAVDLGTDRIYQEHPLETGSTDTGSPNVVTVDFTQGHTLAPEGPTDTGEPEVDRTVILGDHYFTPEEFVASAHVLSAPFWNPALGRTVSAAAKAGSRTVFTQKNKVTFNESNKVKVG